MVKRSIFISLLLLLVFAFLGSGVQAKEAMIPGINCGIAGEVGKDRCCIPEGIDMFELSSDEATEDDGSKESLLEKIARRLKAQAIADALANKRKLEAGIQKLSEDYSQEDPCLSGDKKIFEDPNTGEIQCVCIEEKKQGASQSSPMVAVCDTYYDTEKNPDLEEEKKECINCANKKGYWSAVGCVPLTLSSFISQLILTVGIGFGGLVAVLCIVLNAIRIQVSRGGEEVQKARENITSCILGLILIIFSVFILKIIGYSLLSF